MLFRRKRQTEPEPASTLPQEDAARIRLQARKYSIQFDILPEISYLNEQLCRLIADFLPLCKGFPEGVWLSQQGVEEGLDFCTINFWAVSEEPEAIKEFSIWFGEFFREESVSDLLERFVRHSLEKPGEVEVSLANWSRSHVAEAEVQEIVQREMMARTEASSDGG